MVKSLYSGFERARFCSAPSCLILGPRSHSLERLRNYATWPTCSRRMLTDPKIVWNSFINFFPLTNTGTIYFPPYKWGNGQKTGSNRKNIGKRSKPSGCHPFPTQDYSLGSLRLPIFFLPSWLLFLLFRPMRSLVPGYRRCCFYAIDRA